MSVNRPLQHGDICEVIGGLAREKSPNLKKIVTVDKRVYGAHGMDHAQFGPMYSCIGKDLKLLGDNGEYYLSSKADFAGIWLRRLDEDTLKKVMEKTLELTE